MRLLGVALAVWAVLLWAAPFLMFGAPDSREDWVAMMLITFMCACYFILGCSLIKRRH